MKKKDIARLAQGFVIGVTSFALASVCHSCVNNSRVKAEKESSVYIVCTDSGGDLYASEYAEPVTYNRVYYPLTMDERETLAEILAGKAADRTEACQRMIATVMYNDIMACNGDLEFAMTEYHLKTPGTPTAQIYGVIDAVFFGGEFMLDPEVLWCNDKDHPSAFHDSLVFVCECDGMAFYREHRDNIEN